MKQDNHNRFNPKNERIIYKYKNHIRKTMGADVKTLDALHKSLRSFEILIDFQDFTAFKPEIASTFLNQARVLELSESYLLRIAMDVKHFIRWFANEPDGKKVRYNDADYINLTRNELSAARAEGYKPSHDYNTLLSVVRKMPEKTIVDRRNRALFAIQVLGSFRCEELRNLPIGVIRYDNISKVYFVDINPRKVKGVKFRKARQATLFPVPDLMQWIFEWKQELEVVEGFNDSDPLFPSIDSSFAKNLMFSRSVKKVSLSAQSVRKVFREAYINAGVESLRVHSIRQTRGRYIENITRDDRVVALQQDFGHKNLGTTRSNYGNISPEHQRKLMAEIQIDTGI
jgi:integrase